MLSNSSILEFSTSNLTDDSYSQVSGDIYS